MRCFYRCLLCLSVFAGNGYAGGLTDKSSPRVTYNKLVQERKLLDDTPVGQRFAREVLTGFGWRSWIYRRQAREVGRLGERATQGLASFYPAYALSRTLMFSLSFSGYPIDSKEFREELHRSHDLMVRWGDPNAPVSAIQVADLRVEPRDRRLRDVVEHSQILNIPVYVTDAFGEAAMDALYLHDAVASGGNETLSPGVLQFTRYGATRGLRLSRTPLPDIQAALFHELVHVNQTRWDLAVGLDIFEMLRRKFAHEWRGVWDMLNRKAPPKARIILQSNQWEVQHWLDSGSAHVAETVKANGLDPYELHIFIALINALAELDAWREAGAFMEDAGRTPALSQENILDIVTDEYIDNEHARRIIQRGKDEVNDLILDRLNSNLLPVAAPWRVDAEGLVEQANRLVRGR